MINVSQQTTQAPDVGVQFERMRAVELSMRDFLAALDSETKDESHLLQAWQRCQDNFALMREIGIEPSEVPEAERERFEDALEGLQRLNAVVTAAVGRIRDQLVERLGRTLKTGQLLSNLYSTEQPGSTCDMAG
ncbi:MAG: hypothetical protein ACI841_001367 [Planctomycetota bacterium]